MIEVVVLKNGEPIAHVEIKNIETSVHGTMANYSVKYAVERGSAVGLHTRLIHHFPRTKYNALALVRQALTTLEERELELEEGFDVDQAPVSTDLARRLSGAVREIRAGVGKLHRH